MRRRRRSHGGTPTPNPTIRAANPKEDYITHWPGGRQGTKVRYFRTIGYSYGALLTGWVFSMMFLTAQTVLPNVPREMAVIY